MQQISDKRNKETSSQITGSLSGINKETLAERIPEKNNNDKAPGWCALALGFFAAAGGALVSGCSNSGMSYESHMSAPPLPTSDYTEEGKRSFPWDVTVEDVKADPHYSNLTAVINGIDDIRGETPQQECELVFKKICENYGIPASQELVYEGAEWNTYVVKGKRNLHDNFFPVRAYGSDYFYVHAIREKEFPTYIVKDPAVGLPICYLPVPAALQEMDTEERLDYALVLNRLNSESYISLSADGRRYPSELTLMEPSDITTQLGRLSLGAVEIGREHDYYLPIRDTSGEDIYINVDYAHMKNSEEFFNALSSVGMKFYNQSEKRNISSTPVFTPLYDIPSRCKAEGEHGGMIINQDGLVCILINDYMKNAEEKYWAKYSDKE